jgi:hypothetical protein
VPCSTVLHSLLLHHSLPSYTAPAAGHWLGHSCTCRGLCRNSSPILISLSTSFCYSLSTSLCLLFRSLFSLSLFEDLFPNNHIAITCLRISRPWSLIRRFSHRACSNLCYIFAHGLRLANHRKREKNTRDLPLYLRLPPLTFCVSALTPTALVVAQSPWHIPLSPWLSRTLSLFGLLFATCIPGAFLQLLTFTADS